MITGAYTVMEANGNFNNNYLYYFYLNLDADKRLKPLYTGLRNTISKENFFSFKSFVPPLPEQTAIAQFLDEKTTLIEKAIAIKQKQIELLKERRQVIIQQAVTRGLDPNVKMKYSGVKWIGKIPEGWEVVRLKYVAKIKYGLGQPPKEKLNGLPIIRATNVERGMIVEKGLIFVDPDDVPWERDPILKENDIIVVRSGAYTGDSAIVSEKYVGAIAGYDMVMTPRLINGPFLAISMLAPYVLYHQLYLLRMRAAQPHLNAEELGETLIVQPSLKRQEQIVEYIATITQNNNHAISLKEQEIEKLKEYKATLINSAVTGKIKVC
jgi:type I restriction enzyme, S subunit